MPLQLKLSWDYEALLALRNNRDKLFNPRALLEGREVLKAVEERALKRVRGKNRESRALVTVEDVRLAMKAAKMKFSTFDYVPAVVPYEPKKKEREGWNAW